MKIEITEAFGSNIVSILFASLYDMSDTKPDNISTTKPSCTLDNVEIWRTIDALEDGSINLRRDSYLCTCLSK